MGVVRHLKSLLPLPSFWKGEERSFGNRLEEAYTDLQIKADQNSATYGKGKVSMSIYGACGNVTGSSEDVYVGVPLDKLIPQGATITVNKFEVVMRGINGNVNSQSSAIDYVGRSGYTLSAARYSNGRVLRVRVHKSSDYTNVTNNTPVSVNGTLEFTIS